MIEIELPDGSIAEFPDGTSPEVMQAAIRKRFPGPSEQSQTGTKGDLERISGTLLPFSRVPGQPAELDLNAGVVGAIRRALTLPGEVLSGEVPVMGINPDTGEVGVPPETIGRALETAGVMTPATAPLRSGSGLVPGVARRTRTIAPQVPTARELLKAGGQGFDAMRATGAEFSSANVKQLAETLMARLSESGLDDVVAKNTHRTLKKLANPPEDSVATITNLHTARRTFGEIAGNFKKPSDQRAAAQVRNELDNFISGRSDLVPQIGPPTPAQQAAGRLLEDANANFAAGKRSDLVQGIDRASDLRSAAANSGKNIGNTIRQRVASALLKQRDTAGFSDAEKDLLEGIVRGSRSANVTRDVGNLLGGGGGLGMLATGAAGGGTGALIGGPAGAAIGSALGTGTGFAVKGLSNRITQRALNSADEALRMRSPLFRQRVQQPVVEAGREIPAELLIRALILGGVQNGAQ